MNVRGQSSLKGAYLLLVLAGLWLLPSLVVVFSPLRAQALAPEFFSSDKLKEAGLSAATKQQTISQMSSLSVPRDNPSASLDETSPDKGDKRKTANSPPVSSTPVPSTKRTTSTQTPAATYPTLSLVASPLEAVTPPAALASAGVVPVPSPVVLTDGRPRLVVLEPSDEGWRVFGVAWYWWVAAIILAGGGAVTVREFRRIAKVKETWA